MSMEPLQHRKQDLLEKAKRFTPSFREAMEMKQIVEDDKNADELTKFLALFGLGAMMGYMDSKK